MSNDESLKDYLDKRDFSYHTGVKDNLDELRDVFAAAALNGFLSAGAPPNDWAYVHAAYDYADMMLTKRRQK